MTDPGITDAILQKWHAMNLASGCEEIEDFWHHEQVSFVPYNTFDALYGRRVIANFLARRRAAIAMMEISWSVVAVSMTGDVVAITANQFNRTTPLAGDRDEGQGLTFFGVVEIGPRMCFRHVTEAAPAVLPAMIAAYKLDAGRFVG